MPATACRPTTAAQGAQGRLRRRIVSFNETEDGRLLLALSGVCRFEIVRELDLRTAAIRRVSSLFSPYRADLDHADEPVELDRERPDGGAGRPSSGPQSVDRLGLR
jgi:Lon protease-like protein